MAFCTDTALQMIDEQWRRGEISALHAHHSKAALANPYRYVFCFCLPVGIIHRDKKVFIMGLKILRLRAKYYFLYARAVCLAFRDMGHSFINLPQAKKIEDKNPPGSIR